MNTNDAKLAELLPKFGIDPALGYDGFRAAHPFPVAVRLAMLGKRVMPSNKHKIPMLKEWQHRASADPATLVRWQAYKSPRAWSILCGKENGIEILDVDGAQGRADLGRLEVELGPLPPTWTVISGRESGGAHLWFRAPESGENLRTVAHVFGCAIDVRGWHGHAVLPGSLHKSGNRYRWADGCAPGEINLAELPPVWREALPKRIEGNAAARTIKMPSARQACPSKNIRRRTSTGHVIGDGPDGGGFNRPIWVRCLEFLRLFGPDADVAEFKEALRFAILNANADNHTPDQIERYASDAYLDAEIASARNKITNAD